MLSTWPVKPLTLSRIAIGNKPCQSMAVLLLLYSMLTPLYAENRQNYRIPAQSLDQALVEFSQASGLQVMADGALTQGKRSPGVSGAYSPEHALQQLLSSSGLKARRTNPDTLTVEKNRPSANLDSGKALLPLVKVTAKPDDNGNDTTTLPKVTVEADSAYDPEYYADPYNKDYVIPNATAGTKTNTPIMETPLNVQVIFKQVLKDQQAINLGDALKNVSGVTINLKRASKGCKKLLTEPLAKLTAKQS